MDLSRVRRGQDEGWTFLYLADPNQGFLILGYVRESDGGWDVTPARNHEWCNAKAETEREAIIYLMGIRFGRIAAMNPVQSADMVRLFQ